MRATMTTKGVEVVAPVPGRQAQVLTPEALEFVAGLHRAFDTTRRNLLADRRKRAQAGPLFDFLVETQKVREGDWSVSKPPPDLVDRRVEITGPVDRKMMINAFNSGARVFMADFEDALSPTWANVVEGQANLADAVEKRLSYTSPEGKEYRLQEDIATLVVRPRGWHLVEKHVRVDGQSVSASLFDVGLYLFHNARRRVALGTGPYFYLPKLESHREARLWNEVFEYSEEALGIPHARIRATVLIETLPAAFEMEEILYELRERSAGLNAGRWDYIFSVIKNHRERPEFVLPDRSQVTMTVPFMRAYTELLVRTCHGRGAHAIGGMAAFVPNRKDPEATDMALRKVREDKIREANDGFDGTWVAHPDLVPVAKEVFDGVLGQRPNQVEKTRDDVRTAAVDLLNVPQTPGARTEEGLRNNVSVGIQYIASWLRGVGAAAINNLMEDAATSEIARSQVWQWVRHRATLDDGRTVSAEFVRAVMGEELEKVRQSLGASTYEQGRFEEARQLFERVALDWTFHDFLTIPAYELLD